MVANNIAPTSINTFNPERPQKKELIVTPNTKLESIAYQTGMFYASILPASMINANIDALTKPLDLSPQSTCQRYRDLFGLDNKLKASNSILNTRIIAPPANTLCDLMDLRARLRAMYNVTPLTFKNKEAIEMMKQTVEDEFNKLRTTLPAEDITSAADLLASRINDALKPNIIDHKPAPEFDIPLITNVAKNPKTIEGKSFWQAPNDKDNIAMHSKLIKTFQNAYINFNLIGMPGINANTKERQAFLSKCSDSERDVYIEATNYADKFNDITATALNSIFRSEKPLRVEMPKVERPQNLMQKIGDVFSKFGNNILRGNVNSLRPTPTA